MGHIQGPIEREGDSHQGFTLIELLVVVLIVGFLVGIAVPAYYNTENDAVASACFSNQREIQNAARVYATEHSQALSTLEGVVDASHPLVTSNTFHRPPRCPAAPLPANLNTPDANHGAYALDASGNVKPCGFAGHGSFMR
jgi:prepilin-type N-terminal cleavage/methylation domain-containing protein